MNATTGSKLRIIGALLMMFTLCIACTNRPGAAYLTLLTGPMGLLLFLIGRYL